MLDAGVSVVESIENITEMTDNEKDKIEKIDLKCGINSSKIYYDESADVNDMINKDILSTIKIMKEAKPNIIYAAYKSIIPEKLMRFFNATNKVIDGYSICITKEHSGFNLTDIEKK